MEIVNNIAVRFECPSDIAQTIKSYIERSEVLEDKDGIADIVVHWGLDEMQRLTYLTPTSIKVPSPLNVTTHGRECFSRSIIKEILHGS